MIAFGVSDYSSDGSDVGALFRIGVGVGFGNFIFNIDHRRFKLGLNIDLPLKIYNL